MASRIQIGLSLVIMMMFATACAVSLPTPGVVETPTDIRVPSSILGATSLSAVTHNGGILDIAINADGSRLATAGRDGTAQVWEVASGRQIRSISHNGQVNGVAFNNDGTNLATVSRDGDIRVTAIDSGQILMQGNQGVIDSNMQIPVGAPYKIGDPIPAVIVQYTPNGRYVVSQGSNGMLHVWDPQSGVEVSHFMLGQGPMFTFSHDSRQIAFSGPYLDSGGARGFGSLLADHTTGTTTALLNTEKAVVVGLSADNEYLVVVDEKQIQVWSLSNACVVKLLNGSQGKVSADGSRLTVNTAADVVEVYSLPDLRFIGKRAFPGISPAVALSPDGAFVAAYGRTALFDKNAIIWVVDSNAFYVASHQGPIEDMTFSADGRFLATASATSATVWQTPEMSKHQLRQPAGSVAALPCLEGEGVPGLPAPPTATPDERYTEQERAYMHFMEQNGSAILIAADGVDKWSTRFALRPDASGNELSDRISDLDHHLNRAYQIVAPPRFSNAHSQYMAASKTIAAANREAEELSIVLMNPDADAERATAISRSLSNGSIALEQALSAMGIPFTHDADKLLPEEPVPGSGGAEGAASLPDGPTTSSGGGAGGSPTEGVQISVDGTLTPFIVEAAVVGGREIVISSQQTLPGTLLVSIRQSDRTWRLGVIKSGDSKVRYLNIGSDVLQPILSPDGKMLAFTANEGDTSYIEIYDLQSGIRVRVSPDGQDSQLPSWSPDSQSLLYVAASRGAAASDSRAFIYDRSTQQTRQLTPTRTGWARWSSRGEIVFSTYTGQSFDLFRINQDGSGEINLTRSDDLDEDIATWSPDGEQLVFVRSPRGQIQQRTIYVIQRDGSNIRTVTDLGFQNSNPTWSSDGQVIAFTHSDDAESWQVWLVSLTTREAQPLTQNDDRIWFIQWSSANVP